MPVYLTVRVMLVMVFLTPIAAAANADPQRTALIALFNATNGPSWLCGKGKKTWRTTDPGSKYCAWDGVSCAGNSTNVSSIRLSSCGMTGTLPDALGSLLHLVVLDVSNNSIRGTLPASLAHCTLMQELDVELNQIEGTLPPSYSNWGSSFREFNASTNSLSGVLPESYSAWGLLTKFNVAANHLSGTLPASFSAWNNLTIFTVCENLFTGSIPAAYSNFSLLTHFRVGENQLSGTLSPSFSSWGSISTFEVYQNNLSGALPVSYGASWKSVRFLIASNASFTGSIPNEWGSMASLVTLMLHINHLSGTLPASLGGLKSLTRLAVADNNLSGTLPVVAWSALRNVELLFLQDNPLLMGMVNASWEVVPLRSRAAFALCRTGLCAVPLTALPIGYGCMPLTFLRSHKLDREDAAAAILHVSTFNPSIPCQESPPAAEGLTRSRSRTFALDPLPSNARPLPQDFVAMQRTGVAAALAVGLSAVTGAVGSFADLQVMAAALTGPCSCGRISTAAASIKLSLSPFSSLGSLWVILGNIGVTVVFGAAHRALVALRSRIHRSMAAHPIVPPAAAATLRFPNASIRLALLLFAGVLSNSLALFTSIASPGEVVVGLIGVVYVGGLLASLEWFVYRGRILKLPLRFKAYSRKCVVRICGGTIKRSSWVAPVLFPVGYWHPKVHAQQFGGLVSGLVGRSWRTWVLLPVVNITCQILAALPVSSDSGCIAILVPSIAVTMATAVYVARVRPNRVPFSSVLTALSFSLVSMVSLMSLLCRLSVVTEDTVLACAVGGSVVGILSSLYSVLVRFIEGRFLRCDGDGNPSSVPAMSLTARPPKNPGVVLDYTSLQRRPTEGSARNVHNNETAAPQGGSQGPMPLRLLPVARDASTSVAHLRALIKMVCVVSRRRQKQLASAEVAGTKPT